MIRDTAFMCVTLCCSLKEERPPFDIHDYGGRVVVALNTVGQQRSFSSIVSGLDNYEVCKFLLASLQLVNQTHLRSPNYYLLSAVRQTTKI